MCRSFLALLLTVMLVSMVSNAQDQPLTPGASNYLAGSTEAFLASCRSDLEDTKKQIVAIKASPSPRDAMATLQAFDTAVLVARRRRKSRRTRGASAP